MKSQEYLGGLWGRGLLVNETRVLARENHGHSLRTVRPHGLLSSCVINKMHSCMRSAHPSLCSLLTFSHAIRHLHFDQKRICRSYLQAC